MNSNNYQIRDWSDVIMFAVGIILLSALCYFVYQNQEEKNNLTETERNKRIMDSITDHCNEYN